MMSILPRDRNLLATRSYRDFLAMELNNRCSRKALYSMRALARDLGVSPSSLSNVLAGKGNLSKASVYKIAKRLNKAQPIADYFLHLALADIRAPGDKNSDDYLKAQKIRLEHLYRSADVPFRMVNAWALAPLALAVLLEIEGKIKADDTLPKRLGVNADEFKRMADDLEAIGWIQKSPEGSDAKDRYLEPAKRGSVYELRGLHRRAMEQALECLEQLPCDQRYFHNVVFSMFPAQAEKLGEQLRNVALTMAEEQGPVQPGQEVYTLGNFLVPLTLPGGTTDCLKNRVDESQKFSHTEVHRTL